MPIPRSTGTDPIIDRIDISGYLRTFLNELSKREGQRVEISTEMEALRVKELMNIPKNTTFKSLSDLRSEQPYWHEQGVDCIPSNLGKQKGFIFYFLCTRCDQRVKHLYFYDSLEPPVCRQCCRLPYKQKSYKERKVSRPMNRYPILYEAQSFRSQ